MPSSQAVSAGSNRNSRILLTGAFGAAGGLVGALLGEIQFLDDDYRFFPDNIHLGAGVWFMLAMVGVAIALAATESVLQKNTEKLSAHLPLALAAGLGGGFVAGIIAQFVYGDVIGESSPRLARVIGWAIAGALGGLASGVCHRLQDRLLVTSEVGVVDQVLDRTGSLACGERAVEVGVGPVDRDGALHNRCLAPSGAP